MQAVDAVTLTGMHLTDIREMQVVDSHMLMILGLDSHHSLTPVHDLRS